MRTLIISDIHANLTALEAVLLDVGEYDQVWCLGDLVGYGPEPNECISRLVGLKDLTCVLGNHDAAALGMIDINAFNHDARLSLQWLENKLTSFSRRFLEGLEERFSQNNVTMVHGSPFNPVWEYIFDIPMATKNFKSFESQVCLVGHTHVPYLFSQDVSGQVIRHFLAPNQPFTLQEKSILNPGSVGQPRDRDPRASYMIYDTEAATWELRRVAYDIAYVQARIFQERLPVTHAYRLKEGI